LACGGGLTALGGAVGWRIGAITIGFLVAHQVWERFFFDPFLHLGAMPFAPADPLMLAVQQEGTATLPRFFADVFPHYRGKAMVRFRHGNTCSRSCARIGSAFVPCDPAQWTPSHLRGPTR
jgi:hypothetical protein